MERLRLKAAHFPEATHSAGDTHSGWGWKDSCGWAFSLKCPHKGPMAKACSPRCCWEVVGSLGGETQWEVFRSLGMHPWRGLWTPIPSSFSSPSWLWGVCNILLQGTPGHSVPWDGHCLLMQLASLTEPQAPAYPRLLPIPGSCLPQA